MAKKTYLEVRLAEREHGSTARRLLVTLQKLVLVVEIVRESSGEQLNRALVGEIAHLVQVRVHKFLAKVHACVAEQQ